MRQCAVRFAAWLKDLLHWTHLEHITGKLLFIQENLLVYNIIYDNIPVGTLSTVGAEVGFECRGTGVTLATDATHVLSIRGGV